jgi:xylitol oxidase
MAETVRNWAGNIAFSPADVAAPADVGELCRAVRRAIEDGHRIAVMGAGHSFSPIAATDGTLITTGHLCAIGPLDESDATVTVEAGVRFAELGAWLHERGWALANLPSLPHITVVGAVATATHGSGSALGNLATLVRAIDLVGADGVVRRLERGDERFEGAIVALGCLGVIARVVLDIEPTYDVSQVVWERLAWSAVTGRFDELMGSGYSVSLFTDWRGDTVALTNVKSRDGDPSTIDLAALGATAADQPRHPIPGLDPSACTEQLGRPGPWHERLAHFRAEFTPSHGSELQSEYFVDRRHAAEAIESVRSVGEQLADVLLVGEVRTVAADRLWLSPAVGRDSMALHFTWRLDESAVRTTLALLERVLEPFAPRPHWAKLTMMEASSIRSRYPDADRFDALRLELDPDERFARSPFPR